MHRSPVKLDGRCGQDRPYPPVTPAGRRCFPAMAEPARPGGFGRPGQMTADSVSGGEWAPPDSPSGLLTGHAKNAIMHVHRASTGSLPPVDNLCFSSG
jgi:hypothetical protein